LIRNLLDQEPWHHPKLLAIITHAAAVNIKPHQNLGRGFVKAKNDLDVSMGKLRDKSDSMFASEGNHFVRNGITDGLVHFGQLFLSLLLI